MLCVLELGEGETGFKEYWIKMNWECNCQEVLWLASRIQSKQQRRNMTGRDRESISTFRERWAFWVKEISLSEKKIELCKETLESALDCHHCGIAPVDTMTILCWMKKKNLNHQMAFYYIFLVLCIGTN